MMKTTHLMVLCFLATPAAALAQNDDAPSCDQDDPAVHSLTEAQVDVLVQYAVDRIKGSTGVPKFELAAVERSTGIRVKPAEANAVRAAVMAKLKQHPLVIAKVSGSRCQKYDACSLNRNLSGATGDELAMYEREKKEDGTTYTGRALPRFSATTLDRKPVTSQGLVGERTLVAFLAGHCSHSHDSLSILEKLAKTYAERGLEVVGVFVNSGSVEDVNGWIAEQKPTYGVWVHTDISLGDQIGSHLVPTFFLVDEEGEVREKLVGYKTPDVVETKVRALLGLETADASDCCHPKAG